MNPKNLTTTLTKEAMPDLMPKLQFPDFRGGRWSNVILEDLLAIPATYGIVTAGEFQQEGIPMLRGGDIKDGRVGDGLPLVSPEIHFQYRRTIVQADDVVIALVGYPGEAAVVPSRYVGANISRAVGLLRLKNVQGSRFLAGYLNSSMGRQTVLKPSAGSAQVVVNLKHLNALLIPVPSSAEQQKIADCLGSLDELIAAQARKVDALKTHKKGLMQQLFPREGETQPRLRFPKFQDTGEWVVKPLGEIFPITSSKRVHESDWTPTGVPFYRAREIVALNKNEPIQPLFISEELYAAHSKQTGEIRDGHLLVTGVGSIGVPYLVRVGDRFYFKDGNIIWLKNDGEELSGNFLLRLYESDYVQKQLKAMADVGTVATYTIENAKRTLAAFPKDKEEQQRITDCLTSLDTLITVATQQLQTLQTHKKGLMQQLFPLVEAVES